MPEVKGVFDSHDDIVKLGEIAIMCGQPSGEFPDALNGIQVWTVGRQEFQGEAGCRVLTPGRVQPRMVIPNIVSDDDDLPVRMGTDLA